MRYMSEVEYQNKIYEIDYTDHRPQVYEVEYLETMHGAFERAYYEAFGRKLHDRWRYLVDETIANTVILACGYKFRRSRQWRNTWSYLYERAGGRASGWGKRMVKVLR